MLVLSRDKTSLVVQYSCVSLKNGVNYSRIFSSGILESVIYVYLLHISDGINPLSLVESIRHMYWFINT